MKFTAWDIETDTSGGFGLDPDNGSIASIAAATFDLDLEVTGALVETSAFYGSVDTMGGERNLLNALDDWMHLYAPHGPLVGWNSACFDAPFFKRRSEILGLDSHIGLTFDPSITPKYEPLPGFDGGYLHTWCETEGIDLAVEAFDRSWCEANGVEFSLKSVAEHHGFVPVVVDRSQIHLLDHDGLRAYNLSDVRITAELFAIHRRAGAAIERLRAKTKALEDLFSVVMRLVESVERDVRLANDVDHGLVLQDVAAHLRSAATVLTVEIRSEPIKAVTIRGQR